MTGSVPQQQRRIMSATKQSTTGERFYDRIGLCTLRLDGAWGQIFRQGADWALWRPGTCQAGRLVRRPGGPPRQMLKLVKWLTPLWGDGSEGSGEEGAKGRLARKGELYSFAGPRLSSYATARWAGSFNYQGPVWRASRPPNSVHGFMYTPVVGISVLTECNPSAFWVRRFWRALTPPNRREHSPTGNLV